MKKVIVSILSMCFMPLITNAQVIEKDTVKPDSTHLEKIRKMPMDTIHHKTPVKPVLPEEQKNNKKEDEPITAPSMKKKK